MVARTDPRPQLLVSLHRGEDVEQRIARTAADAARVAVLMIANAGELDDGDKVEVVEA